MCPLKCTTLHHRIDSPKAHNSSVARERRGIQEQSYGTVKGPILDYDVVEEMEEKCGCIYGVKCRSIEGKQIHWLPPFILSPKKQIECGNYVLMCKGIDVLEGRRDIDKRATAEEKPVSVECTNYIQDWLCDNSGNPLLMISESTEKLKYKKNYAPL